MGWNETGLARAVRRARCRYSTGVVNSTREGLRSKLRETGLAICTFSGGLAKFNRVTLCVPKAHGLDAACVGHVKELKAWAMPVFCIKASGRGPYQRTQVTKGGFRTATCRGAKPSWVPDRRSGSSRRAERLQTWSLCRQSGGRDFGLL